MSVDLSKGQVVDLTKNGKEDGEVIKKIRLGGGWDPSVEEGKEFDIDLFAINENGKITYFSAKTEDNGGIPGVSLDGDNLTGEGEGADENIRIDAEKMTSKKVVLVANIFEAEKREQKFSQVKNLFAEIEDTEAGEELYKYNISEEGGEHTAVILGEIEKVDGRLKFTAKGDYTNGDINEIAKKHKPTV